MVKGTQHEYPNKLHTHIFLPGTQYFSLASTGMIGEARLDSVAIKFQDSVVILSLT